jgi:uncharacterized membrane protein
MEKTRLEAFSDGVIAILITIMVLELKVPHEPTLHALAELWPVFLSYVLSFIYLGIYWNNHHHLLKAATKINGPSMWANLHLLFWLSLVPFATAWMGENKLSSWPVALYGAMLFMAGFAYRLLTSQLLKLDGPDSKLAQAVGSQTKEGISVLVYLVAIALAFFVPVASCVLYVLVAIMWMVPDRRVERILAE